MGKDSSDEERAPKRAKVEEPDKPDATPEEDPIPILAQRRIEEYFETPSPNQSRSSLGGTTKKRKHSLITTNNTSTPKIKSGALWSKNKDDLLKTLTELKAELSQLRIQKVTSSGTKLNRIHDLRKSIARVLTIVNLKQRSQLRLFYKNKKYLPLDLRPKQTRAIRRRLSPEEKSQTLEKTKKRQTHFPQRKYAVKATA
ncbi:putative 60s ribosomal protein l35 protein [Eutypa lata UCREL1]|uniref:Putative 60s ribosomal protein l35 protein n=1 Tax=Eutypa lata (strain UCR-EL1) TaxID=1287681 RepID=M7SBM4_EUTLA|nr:putative 60s ribosomal protein l35 protein [Eutypa lata UCREL1]